MAAIWRSSVDFPIPGSPASNMTDPATIPPPSRRSTSGMPSSVRGSSPPGCSDSGVASTGPAAAWNGRAAGVEGRLDSANSAYVPQAPHAEHRPSHFGLVWPQSLQRKVSFCLGLGGTRASCRMREQPCKGKKALLATAWPSAAAWRQPRSHPHRAASRCPPACFSPEPKRPRGDANQARF